MKAELKLYVDSLEEKLKEMHKKAMENHEATTNAQSEKNKSISQKMNLDFNTAAEAMATLSLKDQNHLNKEPKPIKGKFSH